MSNTTQSYPAFAFARLHHVELEAGFILAGQLIVDIPKRAKPTKRERRLVGEIIQQLTDAARSGRMPNDALVFGWHGETRPANAVDTTNDEIMSAWAIRSAVIGVRVDPRNDGFIRIDSDMVRQMGLPKHDARIARHH